MRIIGGTHKGRRFSLPKGNWPTRPTTDFAREALFNILGHYLDFHSTTMLELFGGTGSHAYEMISRGGQKVTVIEKYAPCIDFIEKTSEKFGMDSRISVVKSDVFKYIENESIPSFSYIFADPPHSHPKLHTLPDLIMQSSLLETEGLFVLEHDKKFDFIDHSSFIDHRKYGAVHFTFFKKTIPTCND